MTKSQQAMADVIQLLLDAGFEPDGATKEEIARIPTVRSPLFGRSGGELAKLGGRQRFVKQGANVKATVGQRTTAIYRVEGKGLDGVRGIASLDTRDMAGVAAAIAAIN